MKKYEYRTIVLKQKQKLSGAKEIPELESTLTNEGKKGWRLNCVVYPAGTAIGRGETIILVFEREMEQSNE